MARVIIKYYKCDCCERKFENNNSLVRLDLPARKWDCEGKSYSKGKHSVELCENCFNELYKVVRERFAEIDNCYTGLTVKPKFKTPECLEDEVNSEC